MPSMLGLHTYVEMQVLALTNQRYNFWYVPAMNFTRNNAINDGSEISTYLAIVSDLFVQSYTPNTPREAFSVSGFRAIAVHIGPFQALLRL